VARAISHVLGLSRGWVVSKIHRRTNLLRLSMEEDVPRDFMKAVSQENETDARLLSKAEKSRESEISRINLTRTLNSRLLVSFSSIDLSGMQN
jgi:hypothetical protein